MEVKDLETYEQLQMEVVLREQSILEFVTENKNYEVDNKYFIYGKRIFAFDSNGKFLDCDYEVDGHFICNSDSLISLKGAPKVINKHFSCYACNNLISLEGAPEVVNGDFYCRSCDKLTSLEGAPKIVKGDFYCNYCNNLTSLEGTPEVVKGDFSCSNCDNLTSLEGAPKVIEKDFDCCFCKNLPRNIKKPEGVKGKFYKLIVTEF